MKRNKEPTPVEQQRGAWGERRAVCMRLPVELLKMLPPRRRTEIVIEALAKHLAGDVLD